MKTFISLLKGYKGYRETGPSLSESIDEPTPNMKVRKSPSASPPLNPSRWCWTILEKKWPHTISKKDAVKFKIPPRTSCRCGKRGRIRTKGVL